jgi:hypothetical protein
MKKYEEEACCSREKKEMKNGQTDRPKQRTREGKKAIESKIVTLVLLLLLYNK